MWINKEELRGLYERINELEKESNSIVSCEKCRCLIFRQNAETVTVKAFSCLSPFKDFYCGRCKPDYDEKIVPFHGDKKYIKNKVEVFPNRKPGRPRKN